MSENLKAVVDTQIFLRALINPRSAPGKLFSVWQNDFDLQVSDAIESEVMDVVNRPTIRSKFPHITDESVDAILTTLKMAYRVQTDDPVEAVSRDPKDDIFSAVPNLPERTIWSARITIYSYLSDTTRLKL